MKTITQIFEAALAKQQKRKFPVVYVAIDVHGTIMRPDKATTITPDGLYPETEWQQRIEKKDKFYPNALSCLNKLSNLPNFKLILWTSTKALDDVFAEFGSKSIHIYAINSNPDFEGNSYADFSKKFCFDILLDDKAGFDPMTDWAELEKWLETVYIKSV